MGSFKSRSLALIILIFLTCTVSAESNSTSTSDENPYDKEIQCYSLPYGVFGFVSHLMTYYATIMMCWGKRPLAPWDDLSKSPTTRNVTLSIIHLIITSISAFYTMARCSHAWQFETLAAMKFSLALTSGVICIYPNKWWLFLYVPGAMAGTIGSISLAKLNFGPKMQIITGAFGAAGFIWCIAALVLFDKLYERCQNNFDDFILNIFFWFAFVPFMVIFGALYSDWVLAIAGNNIMGYPYGANKAAKALWVMYWIGKRLNLFMW